MSDSSDQLSIPVEFTIDHTAISVSNLDVSMRFYKDILGFSCERIIDMPDANGRIALLKKEDFTIEMFQFKDTLLRPEDSRMLVYDLKMIGVKHIALRVKDIWTAVAFLKKRGVEFINEPVKGARGFYRFFIKDPDGIPVEITEGLDEN